MKNNQTRRTKRAPRRTIKKRTIKQRGKGKRFDAAKSAFKRLFGFARPAETPVAPVTTSRRERPYRYKGDLPRAIEDAHEKLFSLYDLPLIMDRSLGFKDVTDEEVERAETMMRALCGGLSKDDYNRDDYDRCVDRAENYIHELEYEREQRDKRRT